MELFSNSYPYTNAIGYRTSPPAKQQGQSGSENPSRDQVEHGDIKSSSNRSVLHPYGLAKHARFGATDCYRGHDSSTESTMYELATNATAPMNVQLQTLLSSTQGLYSESSVCLFTKVLNPSYKFY